ncbi:MAG: PAS domain-containing protein [Planctomycetes bacterium]|nr:PAS domain-containing protein [Planctomycetota bacterium]
MRRARTRTTEARHSRGADLEHVLNRDLVRLLALVDGAREALLCLGADGAVLHLNPAAEELFGVHALEVLGRAWREVLPAWLAPALLAPAAPRAAEESRDAEQRWWVCTERGEHELRRRELSAGERLLFLSPSAAPRASAPQVELPSWEALHGASRSAERFAEWTELCGGTLEPEALFALGPALGARVRQWEAEAHARGLAFRARLDERSLAQPLEGEAHHALRALEELVDNAFAFTPRGGAIELCIESEAAGVACRVRNSGAGLGPGEWERARRAFARLSDPLDGRAAGPGLGLALVDAHLERLRTRPLARRDADGAAPSFCVSFHLLGAPLRIAERVETGAAIG